MIWGNCGVAFNLQLTNRPCRTQAFRAFAKRAQSAAHGMALEAQVGERDIFRASKAQLQATNSDLTTSALALTARNVKLTAALEEKSKLANELFLSLGTQSARIAELEQQLPQNSPSKHRRLLRKRASAVVEDDGAIVLSDDDEVELAARSVRKTPKKVGTMVTRGAARGNGENGGPSSGSV